MSVSVCMAMIRAMPPAYDADTVNIAAVIGGKMAQKSPVTTHILDTTLGKPAAGVGILLSW